MILGYLSQNGALILLLYEPFECSLFPYFSPQFSHAVFARYFSDLNLFDADLSQGRRSSDPLKKFYCLGCWSQSQSWFSALITAIRVPIFIYCFHYHPRCHFYLWRPASFAYSFSSHFQGFETSHLFLFYNALLIASLRASLSQTHALNANSLR